MWGELIGIEGVVNGKSCPPIGGLLIESLEEIDGEDESPDFSRAAACLRPNGWAVGEVIKIARFSLMSQCDSEIRVMCWR